MASVYRDDENVRNHVRKLMALPLVPLDHIEQAFDSIESQAPDSIKSLIKYFDGYWMSKVKWSLWNVSDVEMKTNNIVEGKWVLKMYHCYFPRLGWNHRFNRLVSKYHPNIWHLIACLKREEMAVRQRVLKAMTGVPIKKDKHSENLQQRINSLRLLFDAKKISLNDLIEGFSLLIGTKP